MKTRKRQMMSNNGIKFGLIGLGVGLAAGVAAGILLAPKSGKETRGMLKDQAGEASKKVHDTSTKVAQTAKNKVKKPAKKTK